MILAPPAGESTVRKSQMCSKQNRKELKAGDKQTKAVFPCKQTLKQ